MTAPHVTQYAGRSECGFTTAYTGSCSTRRCCSTATRKSKDLKLTVNERKTHIAHSNEGIRFLGVEIGTVYTRIQPKKITTFRTKLKAMTKRNNGQSLAATIQTLNPVLRGFSQYFRIANASRVFKALAGWLRRRLRAIQA